jgi:hypothetical protein
MEQIRLTINYPYNDIKIEMIESFFDYYYETISIKTSCNSEFILIQYKQKPCMEIRVIKHKKELEIVNWVKKHGPIKHFTFKNRDELQKHIKLFIDWVKSIPTPAQRKKLLIKAMKEKIRDNPIIAIMVLLRIYEQQTYSEKVRKETMILNNAGFTTYDAPFMSNIRKILFNKTKGTFDKYELVTSQNKQICNRTQKYASQYLKLINII